MAWCLAAPSHHLTQCRLIILRFSDIHLRAISQEISCPLITKICSRVIDLTVLKSLRGQWVMVSVPFWSLSNKSKFALKPAWNFANLWGNTIYWPRYICITILPLTHFRVTRGGPALQRRRMMTSTTRASSREQPFMKSEHLSLVDQECFC